MANLIPALGGVLPPAAPVITRQPQSVSVTTGSSFSLSVSATGDALSYHWFLNGNSITGATYSSYSVASAALSDADSYTVLVSNSVGTATSNAATVTVNPPIPPAAPASSGGGAPSYWFYLALAVLAGIQKAFEKRARGRLPTYEIGALTGY